MTKNNIPVEKEQEIETYRLKLRCSNCYHSFVYEFPKGWRAEELGFAGRTFLRLPNSKTDNVVCPNCGCSDIRKDRTII